MDRQTSPVKAIRKHCLECAGSSKEVTLCPIQECPLYPFRYGKNPFHSRTWTEEQRQAVAERFAKAQRRRQENHAAGPG